MPAPDHGPFVVRTGSDSMIDTTEDWYSSRYSQFSDLPYRFMQHRPNDGIKQTCLADYGLPDGQLCGWADCCVPN